MPRIVISIGSNVEPYRHVAAALDRLSESCGELLLSPVYESAAIGFDGAPFLNLVAAWSSELSVAETVVLLRAIERDNGYAGGAPKFSSRTLDLDLLLYGDLCGRFGGVELPRADIVEYAYALWPLADIAGAESHPQLGQSYNDLKRQFRGSQVLRKVAFVWRGRDLSLIEQRCAG